MKSSLRLNFIILIAANDSMRQENYKKLEYYRRRGNKPRRIYLPHQTAVSSAFRILHDEASRRCVPLCKPEEISVVSVRRRDMDKSRLAEARNGQMDALRFIAAADPFWAMTCPSGPEMRKVELRSPRVPAACLFVPATHLVIQRDAGATPSFVLEHCHVTCIDRRSQQRHRA